MKYPNFIYEKKLWNKGYDFIVGLDEAGRGPLAGPVTAAAVMIRKFKIKNLKFKINDSKKISVKKREELYEILTNHPAIVWGVGIVSEKVIDKINILEATKMAMRKAISSISHKGKIPVGFLLIDGNFSLDIAAFAKSYGEPKQKSIIKGDEKVFSITSAGIIAKVTRDRIMGNMSKKYPQYGFDSHKGYGTSSHIKNLKKFGPCAIHRKTFYPVSSLVKTKFI